MNRTPSGFHHHTSISPNDLLVNDEVIVLVDDDPLIREQVRIYFKDNGLALVEADSGRKFWEVLSTQNVALILLDIGLPDIDGKALLEQIRQGHPHIAIIMLTGVSDLQIALDCLRSGADDYLSKPTRPKEILLTVKKNLEKRRLTIQNRQYQEELENANFRIQLMHQLSLKMNSVFIDTVELDEILQAILVGITANEGLRFNRAFLAMVDEEEQVLYGRLGIGPGCREEAGKIWDEIQDKKLDFFEIIKRSKACAVDSIEESEINKHIRKLRIPLSEVDNILIRSAFDKKSFKVAGGMANGLDLSEINDFLGTGEFVVVPLYSPRRPIGVIIADNYVTHHPISDSYISALELFSSQASLVIEHSHLYMDMQKNIAELESMNYELARNKDMLVEAERYSALGQMAAQVVHNIRNPITAIGGISRIIAKKAEGLDLDKYTDVMTKETTRLEATLKDLFDFVSQTDISKEPTVIFPLLRKVLHLIQPDLAKQDIALALDFADPDISLDVDPKLISKMLVHLLMNAVEAMPDGGRLAVRVFLENSWLNISILNSGGSIDEDYIDKAKEPFFTTKSYGTGMGLTMANQIVEVHGGSFLLLSRESGTEALVKLPVDSL